MGKTWSRAQPGTTPAQHRRWQGRRRARTAIESRYLAHQREVFHSGARQVVYVKGRRAGGTYGAVLRLVQIATEVPGWPPTRHLWVDVVHRNIGRYVRRYFRPLLRGRPWEWDAEALSLTFPGGSLCDFGSLQHPERMEGQSYDFLWINEAGHLMRNEALYYETLLPMLMESSSAQVFLVGTPKGRGLFERMFRWGQPGGEQGWQSFRHASAVNPRVDPAWLEHLRAVLPERSFRQEILAEFVDDAGSVFRDVERIAVAAPEPAPEPGAPYVIGIDLGRYQDYTAAWVGRADTGAAVACERWQRLSWPLQQGRLVALSRRYGEAPLYVDASGPGDAVCDALEAEGLPVARVRFTAATKHQLVERLALAIERDALRIVPDAQTLRELQAYRYEWSAAGNVRTGGYREHDDCVMALALCCWGMAERGAGSGFLLGAPMGIRDLD